MPSLCRPSLVKVLDPYSYEASFMLEEGATPSQVDRAISTFGMAMGPFTMGDLAGNDIGYNVRRERGLLDPATRPPGIRYCGIADRLCELGRFGQKTGAGWYEYQKAKKTGEEDPQVLELISAYRAEYSIQPRSVSAEEILERCLYSLVNEAFKTLEEGIAARPGDIDVIYVYGYGWPDWRGGPLFWAEEAGLSVVLGAIQGYATRFPHVPHWKPSMLLSRIVASGEGLDTWENFVCHATQIPTISRL